MGGIDVTDDVYDSDDNTIFIDNVTGDIVVEAELGKVGGKEDDLDGGNGGFTDPEEAVRFVEETDVDSLAVAIGTAHGVYKGIPKLDVERLSRIREVVSIPLVLHGTSGIPDEDVKECIRRGICKVNYATDLRIAFTEGVKSVLEEKPETTQGRVGYGGRKGCRDSQGLPCTPESWA